MNEKKEISVHVLKITLLEIDIWRRVVVKSDITLPQLHRLIQVVMGWTNSHLHRFIVDKIFYSAPEFDDDYSESEDYTRVKLFKIADRNNYKFKYEYDFGDSWVHEIKVEKIMSIDKELYKPQCLEGKKACPPEDCGSIPGYFDILEAFKDKNNPEHEELFEWLGDYDPEYFNISDVNRLLLKRNYGCITLN